MARADHAYIGKGMTEHLLLHLKVKAVAAGHHHHIVARTYGQMVTDLLKIAADQGICAGKTRLCHQIAAVVKHRDAEAHRLQDRRQSQRAVPRAEQDGALTDGQRQAEYLSVRLRIADIGGTAVKRQHQNALLAPGNALKHQRGRIRPPAVRGGDKAEQHRHIAAADHADILGIIFVQLVFVDIAALLSDQLLRVPNGQMLHIAAADGAHLRTAPAHQHLRADTARRGSGLADDRHQHGVVLFFRFI